jgi:hypothetical protein
LNFKQCRIFLLLCLKNSAKFLNIYKTVSCSASKGIQVVCENFCSNKFLFYVFTSNNFVIPLYIEIFVSNDKTSFYDTIGQQLSRCVSGKLRYVHIYIYIELVFHVVRTKTIICKKIFGKKHAFSRYI